MRRTRDQLVETGFATRLDDIDRIVALGVSATRFPILWDHPDAIAWARPRMERLRRAGVEPIVTLLHHGSSPLPGGLLDPGFVAGLASFAGEVARAFPWVRRWTPINEPLTTARFATLYGHWYPNAGDDGAFGRAVLNEMRGVAAAMRAIASVVPDAELVTTEDLQGFIAGDADAQAYAAFLDERRFLSLDLLCGRVDARHPLYAYLTTRAQLAPAELELMRREAWTPALAGFNWYPHSERYLATAPDGRPIDVPALYVDGCTVSPQPLLRAAFRRFGLPLALTEVHVHAADARQRVRWLAQRWNDATTLRDAGIPVEAVAAWALVGMRDWHSLLRADDEIDEDGVYTFAGRSGEPQPTLVAQAVRTYARGDLPAPVEVGGWWESPDRFLPIGELDARSRAGEPDGDLRLMRAQNERIRA